MLLWQVSDQTIFQSLRVQRFRDSCGGAAGIAVQQHGNTDGTGFEKRARDGGEFEAAQFAKHRPSVFGRRAGGGGRGVVFVEASDGLFDDLSFVLEHLAIGACSRACPFLCRSAVGRSVGCVVKCREHGGGGGCIADSHFSYGEQVAGLLYGIDSLLECFCACLL